MILDQWQKEFIETKGDKILYCGRQVGKSSICAIDACEFAVNNPNSNILMIAPVERQSYALFERTLDYLLKKYPKMIKKGKDRPTQTRIKLTNGCVIWCLPVGISGIGIRFLTVHRLYGEEASRILPDVWVAVLPMLLTTGGNTILLTTPAGKGTFASDVWNNKEGAFNSFSRFSVSSEQVTEERKVCATWTQQQKDAALNHLAQARARMTKNFYAQEYLGKEVENLMQYFPTHLIVSAMKLSRSFPYHPGFSAGERFLGVDIARMGSDQSVLFSVERTDKERLKQIDMEITEKTLLTETIQMIKNADTNYNYKKIYIDDGGLGAGVFDTLLAYELTRRKVIAINNSARSLDYEDKQRKRILKEDLYSNLLRLLEQGLIELFDDPEILLSLKSVQYEIDADTNRMKIFGNYTHIAEALVRAAWCVKDKSLNIWIA